jgi:hypothetical protein
MDVQVATMASVTGIVPLVKPWVDTTPANMQHVPEHVRVTPPTLTRVAWAAPPPTSLHEVFDV